MAFPHAAPVVGVGRRLPRRGTSAVPPSERKVKRCRDVLDAFHPEKHSNIAVFHYGRGSSHLFAYDAMVSH